MSLLDARAQFFVGKDRIGGDTGALDNRLSPDLSGDAFNQIAFRPIYCHDPLHRFSYGRLRNSGGQRQWIGRIGFSTAHLLNIEVRVYRTLRRVILKDRALRNPRSPTSGDLGTRSSGAIINARSGLLAHAPKNEDLLYDVSSSQCGVSIKVYFEEGSDQMAGSVAEVRLRIVFVGLQSALSAAIRAQVSPQLVEDCISTNSPSSAAEMLIARKANCVFLDPVQFEWRETHELLQLCSETFPVCIVRSERFGVNSRKIPAGWLERLRNYYSLIADISLTELSGQIDFAVRGCHRYLLKKVIHANLNQIAHDSSAAPQIADKALQAATAIKEIESGERGELGRDLGLSEVQMRALFDETVGESRKASQRSQLANFVALGAGLLILFATAATSLVRQSVNPWTYATGGLGAAALIAALITSPSRQIAISASRQIYVQTAYFSFLNQVRLLNSLSPETVLQRSERLEVATSRLLESLRSLPGDR